MKTVAFIDSPTAAPRGAIRINKTLSSGALTGGTAEFKIVGPAPATTTALTVTMGGIDDNGDGVHPGGAAVWRLHGDRDGATGRL